MAHPRAKQYKYPSVLLIDDHNLVVTEQIKSELQRVSPKVVKRVK